MSRPDKILIYVLLNLVLFSYSQAAGKQSATLVETAPITKGILSSQQAFIGSIHFTQTSVLASKTQGLVLRVNFDTTSLIKKGDILVELDHEILDSRIRAIQASLKELKLLEEKSTKDLHRYKKLLKQKNVSQQKYDEIYYEKNRLDQKIISSQAELEALLLEQKQNLITAPFNGVITERHVELGEWVETGGKIATLVNPEKVTALFDIPADYALKIQAEQSLMVQIGQHSFAGTIEGIIIKGDEKSRTFPLKIKIPHSNSALFEGMEAKIKLTRNNSNVDSKETFLVPRDALIKRFGNNVVFVVQDNKAQMIPVDIHVYEGSMVSVSEKRVEKTSLPSDTTTAINLKTGMMVITKGNERIFPEQTIKLK